MNQFFPCDLPILAWINLKECFSEFFDLLRWHELRGYKCKRSHIQLVLLVKFLQIWERVVQWLLISAFFSFIRPTQTELKPRVFKQRPRWWSIWIVLGQHLFQHVLGLWTYSPPELSLKAGFFILNELEELFPVLREEGWTSCQHDVENNPETPYIWFVIHTFLLYYFWSHVKRRADQMGGTRFILSQSFSQTEVSKLDHNFLEAIHDLCF